MSNTQTITFDDFDHWRKAALLKTERYASPKKVTVYPSAKDGPVAELYPTGQVKIRPRDVTDQDDHVKPAWVNYFGAWINAYRELGEIAARQWGPDWIQRVGEYEERGEENAGGDSAPAPPAPPEKG